MTNQSTKPTTADILALIKRSALEKAASHQTDMKPEFLEWAVSDRASIKDERGNSGPDHILADQGAHSLSIRSREKLLNRCAPEGADNASSEVVSSDLECRVKGHAGAQSHLTTASEVAAASLCSSADEEQVVKGCADDTPADDHDDPAGQQTNFYEIKTDLFDNSGKAKKSTIHRAKLMIRSEPTTYAKDADVFMLDFYNRSRDINKRLREMEVDDDEWYVEFLAEFERCKAMLVTFDIAPKLAVLKEIIKDDGSSEVIGYAAGIMYQIKNQQPNVILRYGASRYQLVLDFEFNRTPGSTIYKKGIYRDADRQHMDVELSAPKKKFKIKTAKDFS